MTSSLHYRPFVRGIHWWPVDSPHKGPVMHSLDNFFDIHVNNLLDKLWSHQWVEMSQGEFKITPSGKFDVLAMFYQSSSCSTNRSCSRFSSAAVGAVCGLVLIYGVPLSGRGARLWYQPAGSQSLHGCRGWHQGCCSHGDATMVSWQTGGCMVKRHIRKGGYSVYGDITLYSMIYKIYI